MPMITRLGVSSLWRSSERFSEASQPFFQESALNSLIRGYLKTENKIDLIWNCAMLYSNGVRSDQTEFADLYYDAVTDHFVSWEVVRYRNMEAPFVQWVKKVRDCVSYDVLKARVSRLDGWCVLTAPVLPRVDFGIYASSHSVAVLRDILPIWAVSVGKRATGTTSGARSRVR